MKSFMFRYFNKQIMKNKSMGKRIVQMLIPTIILIPVIIIILFQSMVEARRIVYRSIEEMAGLRIEQISTNLIKINYEMMTLLNTDKDIASLPKKISPSDGKYYELLWRIREKNGNLKTRYKEAYSFFVYEEEAQILILDQGMYFSRSQKEGLYLKLMNQLADLKGISTTFSEWDILNDGKEEYLFSRYAHKGKVIGCVIRVNDLLEILNVTNLGYEGIPFVILWDGTMLSHTKHKEFYEKTNYTEIIEGGSSSFPLRGMKDTNVYMLFTPDSSKLEHVMRLQIILVILGICLMLGAFLGIWIYYKRVLIPMKHFVKGLKNIREEQWIHENGTNDILELEMASKEFKGLLRKIKSLKIEVYEKEISRQKTELEYMQEQIKPHFYLNCLNLIHGIAEVHEETEIMTITKMLSDYMGYVMGNSFASRKLADEIAFIKSYVEIQRFRYGMHAFSYEIIVDEELSDYLVPAMLIHTFVENAFVHAVSLDKTIEITLYIVIEQYQEDKILNITLSDTGKGFSEKMLDDIRNNHTIYYNDRKHIGIQNAMKRLNMMYGESAGIQMSNMDKGFGAVVEIMLPARRAVGGEE